MPSSTPALSTEDKAKVKKAIPTSSSTNKIITAAVARVYQARDGARRLLSCSSFFEDDQLTVAGAMLEPKEH